MFSESIIRKITNIFLKMTFTIQTIIEAIIATEMPSIAMIAERMKQLVVVSASYYLHELLCSFMTRKTPLRASLEITLTCCINRLVSR